MRAYPRAITQSSPPLTRFRARYNAVDPVLQLLLQFTMGMPERPKVYIARCPARNPIRCDHRETRCDRKHEPQVGSP